MWLQGCLASSTFVGPLGGTPGGNEDECIDEVLDLRRSTPMARGIGEADFERELGRPIRWGVGGPVIRAEKREPPLDANNMVIEAEEERCARAWADRVRSGVRG